MFLYIWHKVSLPANHLTWTWRRHDMDIYFALLILCEGNPLVTGLFPHKGIVIRRFHVSFDIGLNKQLKGCWSDAFDAHLTSLLWTLYFQRITSTGIVHYSWYIRAAGNQGSFSIYGWTKFYQWEEGNVTYVTSSLIKKCPTTVL